MSTEEIDILYKPFPSFVDWASCSVNYSGWEEFVTEQEELVKSDHSKLNRALKIVSRAAAVETGAIESLYETDRGFTITVAQEIAYWEAAVDEKGEAASSLIHSQLSAYETVLDFATKSRPIADAWIRELHTILCEKQETYLVQTAAGPQQQRLYHGEYKTNPNHVRTKSGQKHAYAPVDMTGPEMERFIKELNSPEFESAHPILQAAYAHYSFVAIHPFADGNGRVARAVASVFTYRKGRIPFFVTSEHKRDYFATLAEADAGNYQKFLDFVSDRAGEAIVIVKASIEAAAQPDASEVVEEIGKFYETPGGYSFEQIDLAGHRLLEELKKLFQKKYGEEAPENLSPGWSMHNPPIGPPNENVRAPVNKTHRQSFRATITSPAPANASASMEFKYDVPIEGGSKENVIITAYLPNVVSQQWYFETSLENLIPAISTSTLILLDIFCRTQLSILFQTLRDQGRAQLKNAGYIK